jgi:hypothetical protein
MLFFWFADSYRAEFCLLWSLYGNDKDRKTKSRHTLKHDG